MANYPTELEIVKENLDEKLPTKFCLKVRYIDYARDMVNDILNEYKSGNIIDLKGLTERIHKKGNELKEYCNKNVKFIKCNELNDVYNRFVGDTFEAFAEFMFKWKDGDARFGVSNYKPVTRKTKKDFGVDGYGESAKYIGNVAPRVVVQIKFRSGIDRSIKWGDALSHTAVDGVWNYDLKPHTPNSIILFGNDGVTAHWTNDEFFDKKELFVISDNEISNEMKSTSFWEAFAKCF